jgi:hypothetical protein
MTEPRKKTAREGGNPGPPKKVRKKNIRTHRREAEELLQAGEAVFISERLATEWFGSPMLPWRPTVLSDQNREQAFAVKKEIQPWVKVILGVRRQGARRTLGAQETEREILQRHAAGESLPPALFTTKTSKPVPDANLRWLVGLVYSALARCDGREDAESITDLITRRLFSKLGLPESGTEPLRSLLRPLGKRRREPSRRRRKRG